MRRIRAWVDKQRCMATQGCISVAPEAFALEADHKSSVLDPAAVPEGRLWEAAQICPTGAIIIEDADTGERLFP